MPAPTFDRAYSILHVKAIQEDQRVITGVATTPEPDRIGDIIEPLGVQFKNPLPLLLYHDNQRPVGTVVFDPPTKAGIKFTARLPKIEEPGTLQARVDEAWQSIKSRLVTGVSIGFRSVRDAIEQVKETGGWRFLKTEVLELSLVTVPANASAQIYTIRSLDIRSAAPGTRPAVPTSVPGVSGFRQVPAMNISEQITQERAELQAKSARLEELMQQDDQEGGLADAESTERDTLTETIKGLTKKIDSLSALEAAQAKTSKPVTFAPTHKVATYAPRIEVVKPDLPKGTLFARYAMAVAAGKGSLSDTLAYAKRWDSQTPEVSAYIKAIEGTSVVGSPAWGGELVYQNNLASEFVELLRAATILGRINGFRMTPFNVRIPVQSGGSTVAWVGEAAPKPVTELAFTTITMAYHKVAGIVVLTEELVRLSNPNAEETVRRDLTEQIARFLDVAFIDPTVAAGANSPASITNAALAGATAATGTDATAVLADLNAALATFDTANIGTDGLVLVTTPAIARGISTLLTPLGTLAFPAMSPSGGTLLGYPVVVSGSVPAGYLCILKPSEILMADDGRVSLDASNQATLDMDGGSPYSPSFNLWQKNCIGIRAERWITWTARRADAVSLISGAAYGPAVGSP